MMEEELPKTHRELAAARRALQERCYAQSQPISSQITVAALTAVLNHTIPEAMAEAQRDRPRLAEQLREVHAGDSGEKHIQRDASGGLAPCAGGPHGRSMAAGRT
jgi:hypothetical protein